MIAEVDDTVVCQSEMSLTATLTLSADVYRSLLRKWCCMLS